MDSIQEALAPVLQDVAATTEVRLEVEFGTSGVDGPWVRIGTSDGSATTFHINPAGTHAEQVAAAAEQVQEVIIEEQWARASNWPMCPRHRSTHPLEVATPAAEAWWKCPIDDAPVAPIGALRI